MGFVQLELLEAPFRARGTVVGSTPVPGTDLDLRNLELEPDGVDSVPNRHARPVSRRALPRVSSPCKFELLFRFHHTPFKFPF